MKRHFAVSMTVVLALLVIVMLTAQTTTDPDIDVTLTTTTADPEVRAVPVSFEAYGLNTVQTATGATMSVRLCYQYYRQSGAPSRIECRAITNGSDNTTTDPTSLNGIMNAISPRTSTAQPAFPPKRFVGRIASWTNNNGGPPNATLISAPRARSATR